MKRSSTPRSRKTLCRHLVTGSGAVYRLSSPSAANSRTRRALKPSRSAVGGPAHVIRCGNRLERRHLRSLRAHPLFCNEPVKVRSREGRLPALGDRVLRTVCRLSSPGPPPTRARDGRSGRAMRGDLLGHVLRYRLPRNHQGRFPHSSVCCSVTAGPRRRAFDCRRRRSSRAR